MKFEEINLSENIKRALAEYSYEEATIIQEKAIPVVLEGRDIIGQSQTGTGKTAAYSLPILESIDKSLKKVQALILCPTRELAVQVVGEIRKFAKYEEGIKTIAIYGGEAIERQILALKKGVQIVVGTPGRVMDHMRRKTLKLKDVKMVVLDEADEMLNMGFEEDINTILAEVPEERQTVLFSATMNQRILGVAKKYLKDPFEIKIPTKELTVDRIKQISIPLKNSMKDEVLSRVIDCNNPKKCVVFCNTKRKVDELIENLKKKGYKAESLHGDVKQDQRERIMKRFKNGDYQLLIATDVVARGIDVDDLELVINYDIPQEEEYYVHRIGRTGRNGSDGKAYTFVVGREKSKLASIEKYAKTKIEMGSVPSDNEILEIKSSRILNKIQNEIETENYAENQMIQELYEKLQTANDQEKTIKALLQMAVGKETQITSLNLEEMFKQENKRRTEKDNLKRNGFSKIEKVTEKSGKKREDSRKDSKRDSKKDNKKDNKKDGKKDIQKSAGKVKVEAGNQRFFVSLGKLDAIKPKDIVGSITSNTSIAGSDIGKIDIMNKFSFIEVPSQYEGELLNQMSGKKIKGKEVRIEVASRK